MLTAGLGDNVLSAFGVTSGVGLGLGSFGFSRLVNLFPETMDSRTFVPIAGAFGLVEFAGTTTPKGVKDLDTAFEMSTDTTVAFHMVPEPSTLFLLGFGLVALGLVTRRRVMR